MTYIIGEIGQNHNGSVEIAKSIVGLVTSPIQENLFNLDLKGMDAVKLTKRDLSEELTESKMNEPYTGRNSFGSTYGKHREALELSDEEHKEVYQFSKDAGLDFVETICSIGAMSLLKHFTPDKLKVASRDLTNLPLLEALSETKIPMIISTGMAGQSELDNAIDIITKKNSDLSILHCVSEYPTHPQNVNLNTIRFLQKNYPGHKVGYSDHTIGISAAVAAVALGAEIIEKHITLHRDMRGTDQRGSLGPDGVKRMVRDIRLMEMSTGDEAIFIDPSVRSAKQKLERSIASKVDLLPGDILTEDSIHLLSPGTGLSWTDRSLLIGQTVKKKISKNELISLENLSQ